MKKRRAVGQKAVRPTQPLEDQPSGLSRKAMVDLYTVQKFLSLDTQKETGLRFPVDIYFKDPLIAELYQEIGIDEDFTTPWEPGLADGPTSARFAVVDFDATTGTLTPPAVWDRTHSCFRTADGVRLDGSQVGLYQFHQQSVWATVQNTLDYFESGFGLGRRISWAFEGNRLIILPHAGYGENAFYDRESKSLQFYYFRSQDRTVYTCLSSDIVNHEFGHAVLDGLRPHYYETVTGEGAAFHEFVGDLTAILMALRNNAFRRHVLARGKADQRLGSLLADIAPEFGQALEEDQLSLRSALNDRTMKDFGPGSDPHDVSEVLTGAMFDILEAVFEKQRSSERAGTASSRAARRRTDVQALAQTVPRMQTMAIQPLDLLPPCGVTFRDYALAVLRTEQVANPTDPRGYRAMMLDVFIKRGILKEADREELLKPGMVFHRPQLDVFHPISSIAASAGGAYRFLDDNRRPFLIPPSADLMVGEVVRARKLTRDGRALPDQIIVQYTWREEVELAGRRFGAYAGGRTTLLCGGTMVLDEQGNQIHWARQPGTDPLSGTPGELQQREQAQGRKRRDEFLDALAARVADGSIGEVLGGEMGLMERSLSRFGVQKVNGEYRFSVAPHFSLAGHCGHREAGDGPWQISF